MPCGCRLEHKELEQMEPILNPKTGNFTAYTVTSDSKKPGQTAVL